MSGKVLSAAPIGYDGAIIEVESDAKAGLPVMQIVGMGNKSIDEARQRVRSAILNSLLDFPARKLVVNLAPAELPKDGTYLDLPIALSVLIVAGQLRQTEVEGALFVGELALDGRIRPVRGVINIAETARSRGLTTLYVPLQNAPQAQMVPGMDVYGVERLSDLYLHLKGERRLKETVAPPTLPHVPVHSGPTIDDIRGQLAAKRALVIACAGRHNLLFTGPPGTGKSMLARVIPSLLPALSPEEQVAVTKLHSLSGDSDGPVSVRPFRAPHHTASATAIIGGGTRLKPGEISLAHHGVLFLDELPEFSRSVLEALRQPLEDNQVVIARTIGRVTYPADVMLVAAMNPCPCGYYGDPVRECTCTASRIASYKQRLSGPLLDRIDLRVTMSRMPQNTLLTQDSLQETQHSTLVKQILNAQKLQKSRYKSSSIYNGNVPSNQVVRHITLPQPARRLLDQAAKTLDLSARSYFKILRVARTIADLEPSLDITPAHVAEALQFR